ncbi:MAG: NlpC/P60 family protein [Dethiobacteria bacterium]|jgi:cell wall-associated NlpC family hydrolase
MKGIIKVPLTNVYCAEKSEVVTQAIFATEVDILGEKEGWCEIRIPVQQDYLGWVEKENIFYGYPPETFLGKVIVQKHLAELKKIPLKNGPRIMELALNTRLWIIERQQRWYKVWLPGGGVAWIKAGDVSWEKPPAAREKITGERILNLARSFLGVPYLWGGITPEGLDCSGLVYTIYALCEVYLHRDCHLQFKYDGFPVKFDEILPGDLIYFYEDLPEKPTHVGIYEADHIFINASSRQGSVVRYSLLENNWHQKISGIKRVER